MTKQEFLNELRVSLSGKISSSQIESHVKYYEEYMNAEIRKGKSEEEVLSMLGNPRLIARSILEAEKQGTGSTKAGQNGADTYFDGRTDYEESDMHGYVYRKKINLPAWIIALLAILAVVAVLGIVAAVLWWLAPIILAIWLIVFLIKMLDQRK